MRKGTKNSNKNVPAFLTQTINANIKEDMRKAYAMYLQEEKKTPQEMEEIDISINFLNNFEQHSYNAFRRNGERRIQKYYNGFLSDHSLRSFFI